MHRLSATPSMHAVICIYFACLPECTNSLSLYLCFCFSPSQFHSTWISWCRSKWTQIKCICKENGGRSQDDWLSKSDRQIWRVKLLISKQFTNFSYRIRTFCFGNARSHTHTHTLYYIYIYFWVIACSLLLVQNYRMCVLWECATER